MFVIGSAANPRSTGTDYPVFNTRESALAIQSTSPSQNMTTKPFGRHPVTGEEFTLTTVTSKPHGIIQVSFTNLGATIVSWKIGELAKKELVLGFKDGASYLSSDNPFFGLSNSMYANPRCNYWENCEQNSESKTSRCKWTRLPVKFQ